MKASFIARDFMTKKEIAEIKRRFTLDHNNITCIRGCYVNTQGQVISAFTRSLVGMAQEEAEKYLAIFKRTLSGEAEQSQLTLDFTPEQVMDSEEHRLLTALRDTALKEDEPVNYLFQQIIDHLHWEDNYLILLMHDGYDVPYRSRDGERMQEMDTEVFHYVLCSICPVKMTKPALTYDAGENLFHSKEADWVVGMPEVGFMFPCFDQRAANIYSVLYYTRDTAQIQEELIDALFHASAPMPAAAQKETFQAILQDALAEECSYEVMQTVHEQVLEKIEEQKADKTAEQPPQLSRQDVDAVLADCGVTEEKRAAFDAQYDAQFGQAAMISAANVSSPKQFEVRTPDVVIKVSPTRSDLVETRIIDGHPYILIRAESGVEVNGVSVQIEP